MCFEKAGVSDGCVRWRVAIQSQQKRDEVQKRKEKNKVKQAMLSEEQATELSKTFWEESAEYRDERPTREGSFG
jgi:hypothetical protein